MTDERALYDPGLQPERTELAWRRTALSIGVGSIVAARILPDVLGSIVWALPGVLGMAFAIVMWSLARRRYLSWNDSLLSDEPSAGRRLPGAGLLFTLTVFTVGCGAVLLIATVLVSPR